MRVLVEHISQLWYENGNGDRFVPDLRGDHPLKGLPPGYDNQCTQTVNLEEKIFEAITEERVANCNHPRDMVIKDLGLIDGLDGEICRSCGGTRGKETEKSEWGAWHGGGSRFTCASTRTWNEQIVLAMTRPTPEERALSRERWNYKEPWLQLGTNEGLHQPNLAPPLFGLQEAMIIAGSACERCMNALCWMYGAKFSEKDGGYPEMSDEWKRAGTVCHFCEYMGYQKPHSETLLHRVEASGNPDGVL